jgi:hypothetical protein
MFAKILVILIKISIIGFFTFIYVTPLFLLFYVIIFQNFNLLNEITLKYYSIAYGIGYLLLFLSTLEWSKNSVNE